MRPFHFAWTLTCFVLMLTGAAGQGAPGLDWPQWRGPERNGISRETGLASQWPASGPPVVWSATNVGAGYGSMPVSHWLQFTDGKITGLTAMSPDAAERRRAERE